MRKFVIEVKNGVDENGFMDYEVKVIVDGEIVVEKEYDNIGDCLSDLYRIERKVYDDYEVDSRIDELKVKVDINL